MLLRQKILLSFLRHAEKEVSRLSLVKWSFLLSQEVTEKKFDSFYQFVPYRYGPFSFSLYHELNQLATAGLVMPIGRNFIGVSSIASASEYKLDMAIEERVKQFQRYYGKMSSDQLLGYVYEHYPWFTLKTVLADRRAVQPVKADVAIYTAGYEGFQIDGFFNRLLSFGMTQIIDVRRNPISRKYGFHKSTLAKLAGKLNIRYEHIPELGIPSEYRSNLETLEDYEALFDSYEQEILPVNRSAVAQAATLISSVPSVLICQEADPRYCHRTRLALHIHRLTGLRVYDLGAERWLQTNLPEQKCLLQ